jgi:hypothetical protein
MDMTKFDDTQSAGYQAVLSELWRWAKEIRNRELVNPTAEIAGPLDRLRPLDQLQQPLSKSARSGRQVSLSRAIAFIKEETLCGARAYLMPVRRCKETTSHRVLGTLISHSEDDVLTRWVVGSFRY